MVDILQAIKSKNRKITFIVGSSRSGTSILGELVASNPRFMYLFEDTVWGKYITLDHHASNINDVSYANIQEIRKHFIGYNHTNIVEKNPRHIVRLPLIKYIFPRSKIIHIVRDGRDVSCSLKSGLCGKTWSHVKSPRWRDIKNEYQGVMRCAHSWKDIMEIAIKDLRDIEHLQVKYEDLVDNTKDQVYRICDYLDCNVEENMLEFASKIQNNVSGSYVAKNQNRWCTDDHYVRIDRWKLEMSEDERKSINALLYPILEHFGYIK